jgi:hypothetical protein
MSVFRDRDPGVRITMSRGPVGASAATPVTGVVGGAFDGAPFGGAPVGGEPVGPIVGAPVGVVVGPAVGASGGGVAVGGGVGAGGVVDGCAQPRLEATASSVAASAKRSTSLR